MMKTVFETEKIIGTEYYITDSLGTGGVLRKTPEDFTVKEIYGEKKMTGGPYLICELEKRNWELQRAVKEISKRLGISHRRIGWAGTKDKNAVTTQLISLYNIDEERISALSIKDMVLKPVGRANAQLSLGELKGNGFGITISDCECSRDEMNSAAEECRIAGEKGIIPNYYGIQRFGAARPVSHLAGLEILKGNYESAVACYVGMSFPDEKPETREARDIYYKNRDPVEGLNVIPVFLRYERAMLHHLTEKPGDYQGALKVLPPKLLSMLVSACQSYIFNRALSHRIGSGTGLNEIVTGDRIIFSDGKEDIADEKNINTAKVHMRRGRCMPAIFMPGSEDYRVCGETDTFIEEIMAELGIDRESYRIAAALTETSFKGNTRPVAIKADISYEISESSLKLDFTLPPGHYATTVCREIMKTNPLNMA